MTRATSWHKCVIESLSDCAQTQPQSEQQAAVHMKPHSCEEKEECTPQKTDAESHLEN